MDINHNQHHFPSILGWVISVMLFVLGKILPLMTALADQIKEAIIWLQLLCFIASLFVTLMTIVINWKKFIDKWKQLFSK